MTALTLRRSLAVLLATAFLILAPPSAGKVQNGKHATLLGASCSEAGGNQSWTEIMTPFRRYWGGGRNGGYDGSCRRRYNYICNIGGTEDHMDYCRVGDC